VYTQTPFFVNFRSSRFVPSARASWLWLVPGVALILLAVAIIIWPELLAYLVAGAIMTAGILLTGWGWAMRQATRHQTQHQSQAVYRVYPDNPS
jgi:hypothetical protein